MSHLAVHVLSGPKLTSAPISLRSRRDCLSWKKELIGATVFMGKLSYWSKRKCAKNLIDNAEQLTTLKDTCVVTRKSIEVVLTLWNLGKTSKYELNKKGKGKTFVEFSNVSIRFGSEPSSCLLKTSPRVHFHPQELYSER